MKYFDNRGQEKMITTTATPTTLNHHNSNKKKKNYALLKITCSIILATVTIGTITYDEYSFQNILPSTSSRRSHSRVLSTDDLVGRISLPKHQQQHKSLIRNLSGARSTRTDDNVKKTLLSSSIDYYQYVGEGDCLSSSSDNDGGNNGGPQKYDRVIYDDVNTKEECSELCGERILLIEHRGFVFNQDNNMCYCLYDDETIPSFISAWSTTNTDFTAIGPIVSSSTQSTFESNGYEENIIDNDDDEYKNAQCYAKMLLSTKLQEDNNENEKTSKSETKMTTTTETTNNNHDVAEENNNPIRFSLLNEFYDKKDTCLDSIAYTDVNKFDTIQFHHVTNVNTCGEYCVRYHLLDTHIGLSFSLNSNSCECFFLAGKSPSKTTNTRHLKQNFNLILNRSSSLTDVANGNKKLLSCYDRKGRSSSSTSTSSKEEQEKNEEEDDGNNYNDKMTDTITKHEIIDDNDIYDHMSQQQRIKNYQLPPPVDMMASLEVSSNDGKYKNLVDIDDNNEDDEYSSTAIPFYLHFPKTGGTSLKAVMACMKRIITLGDPPKRDSKGIIIPDSERDVDDTICTSKDESLRLCPWVLGTTVINADLVTPKGVQRAAKLGLLDDARMSNQIINNLSNVAVSAMQFSLTKDFIFNEQHRGRLFLMIRNPIERHVSQYYYVKKATWEWNYNPSYEKMSMIEYYHSYAYDNQFIRQLLDIKTKDFEFTKYHLNVAKEILRQKTLILLLSNFDESIERLIKFFNWSGDKSVNSDKNYDNWPPSDESISCIQSIRHSNQNTDKPYNKNTISDHEYTFLLQYNKWDMELYRYALELWDHQGMMFN